jgi:pyruvate/2-oxoglutarate dehydrogenase complex dihydrolipoamide dehydrogenase (E3) component
MHTRLPYTASAAITWHKVQCGGCSQCSPSELTNAAFNTFDTIPAADVQTDVLVIGAGMSGIAAAKELHTAGKQFIIIEGTGRVGGRIKTGNIGSSDVEQGASWIHGARARGGGGNNPIWDLAAQLRLEGKFSKWVNTVTYDSTGLVADANVRWTPSRTRLPARRQSNWQ